MPWRLPWSGLYIQDWLGGLKGWNIFRKDIDDEEVNMKKEHMDHEDVLMEIRTIIDIEYHFVKPYF